MSIDPQPNDPQPLDPAREAVDSLIRERDNAMESIDFARDVLSDALECDFLALSTLSAMACDRLKSQQPPKRCLWVRNGEPDREIRWAKWALFKSGNHFRTQELLWASEAVARNGTAQQYIAVNRLVEDGEFDGESPSQCVATSDDPDELREHARKLEEPKWSPGDKALMGLDLDSAHLPVTVKSIHGYQAVVQRDGVAGVEVCAVVNLKARGAQ